jgi:ATP/maltotriose-dependent transcriptional regulator MalT
LCFLGYFLNKKLSLQKDKMNRVIEENDKLKEKLAILSLSDNKKARGFYLDKNKIEQKINSKLGESSWQILNLLFKNPSISNKEIASEVSLSLEGVSSSLRRMYQNFGIQNSSNKKVALLMKAIHISFEEKNRIENEEKA